ncbi:MAG: hypothetical protein M3178_00030 [Pseudomonadota bacterium]|nr:hypothetical protein [Pseudomonadota bacterium]
MSDVYDQKAAALQKFTETGADHNCPFCRGRMISNTSPGDRIFFLNGVLAGYSATVSALPSPIEGEFLVHVDGASDERQARVSYSRDLFVTAPLRLVPKWMCPLSMRNLCALEDAAVRGMLCAFESGGQTIRVEVAQTLAAVAWGRRLPVNGAQLWKMLQVHGFDDNWKSEFCLLFDFGFSLLVTTHRRRPVRKKIVEAMLIDH